MAHKDKFRFMILGIIVVGIIITTITYVNSISDTPGMVTPVPPSKAQIAATLKEDAMRLRAGLGAVALYKQSSFPSGFRIASSLVIPSSGAVCYEYTQVNALGLPAPHQAILTKHGKLLTGGADAINGTWNRLCANRQGIETNSHAQ